MGMNTLDILILVKDRETGGLARVLGGAQGRAGGALLKQKVRRLPQTSARGRQVGTPSQRLRVFLHQGAGV